MTKKKLFKKAELYFKLHDDKPVSRNCNLCKFHESCMPGIDLGLPGYIPMQKRKYPQAGYILRLGARTECIKWMDDK